MWFESTFVFSMLEPWEKIMLCKYTKTSFLYLNFDFYHRSRLFDSFYCLRALLMAYSLDSVHVHSPLRPPCYRHC